jgi:hypothetical protein
LRSKSRSAPPSSLPSRRASKASPSIEKGNNGAIASIIVFVFSVSYFCFLL